MYIQGNELIDLNLDLSREELRQIYIHGVEDTLLEYCTITGVEKHEANACAAYGNRGDDVMKCNACIIRHPPPRHPPRKPVPQPLPPRNFPLHRIQPRQSLPPLRGRLSFRDLR